METYLPKLDSSLFIWLNWRAGSIRDLGVPCRYLSIVNEGRHILKKYAIGWCYGENLMCRPKENHIALMCFKDGEEFWFHLRYNEFHKVFCK